MMLISSSRVRRATFVGLVTAVAAACGTKEAPGPLEPSGAVGRVRFVNLITDPARGTVNAILEGVPFGVNLAYTQTTPASLAAPSTAPYASILTGSRTLVLKRTADTNVTVATIGFTITDGQDRTVYATGGAGGGAVSAVVTTDSNPAAAATQARVRLVNLSPAAGTVDAFLTAAGADLAAATPTATSVPNGGASAYLAVAPGTYTLRLVPAGTAPASRAAAVSVTLTGIALAGGTGRTIVVADRSTGGAPAQAFVLTDR
ncbi:MAG: DUF4397 domain-containing protein [Gemmatirosa sp.]|nr:DUF4397 domain-containing protein [Gemmatirosa sp.]